MEEKNNNNYKKAPFIKELIVNSILAALYIVVTIVFSAVSFGPIQFRIAEMLNHLIVFNKKYAIGILLGVLLSNTIFMSASGLGMYDLVFGLGHSIISMGIAFFVFKFLKTDTQKMIALSLIFSVMMFLIAIELFLALELPFWLSYGQTFIGEIVVMLAGVPIMKFLNRIVKFDRILS